MTPLQKSLAINSTLVALALGSLGLVVLTERAPTSSEIEARRRHLLERFEEDLVDRITLRRAEGPGQEALTIERGSGDPRFIISAPVEAVAEEATVDRLLRELRFATWLRRIPSEDVDKARMGLAEPTSSIELDQGGGHTTLTVGGDASSPKGARYVEVEDTRGTAVYVVSGATAAEFAPKLADFRIQRLIPVPESELHAVELSSRRGRIRLERREHWLLLPPQGETESHATRLDPATVDRLFLQFARTQAQDFLSLEQAAAAQANREDLVTLTLLGKKAEERSEIVIGGKCPTDPERTVAWRKAPEPIAACVQSDVESAFLEHTGLLLDRKLFAMRVDEAEEVRIEVGDARLEFARKEDAFVMRAPERGDIDRRAGAARLSALLEARGAWLPKATQNGPASEAKPSRAASAKAAQFEPRARASVSRGGARETEETRETVELGAVGEHRWVVRRVEDGALLEVDEETARAFEVDALMLKSPVVVDVAAEDLREIELRWKDDGVERTQKVTQPQRGVFELSEPTGFEVDSGLAMDLVDGLHRVEVNAWVSDLLEPRFGLTEPTLTCRFLVRGNDAPRVLEFGGPAPDGNLYATLDRRGVFVVSRGLRDLLATWVVDRSPFLVDSDRLERLELVARDRRLELSRVGSSFIQSSPGPVVSPARIVDLLDALASLRTEGLVSPSAPELSHGTALPVLRVNATLRGDTVGSTVTQRFTIGNADTRGDVAVFYAWLDSVSALYALPRESVRRMLNLW